MKKNTTKEDKKRALLQVVKTLNVKGMQMVWPAMVNGKRMYAVLDTKAITDAVRFVSWDTPPHLR